MTTVNSDHTPVPHRPDPGQLDVRSVQVFLEVASQGSLNAAARALHLDASAVSKHITKLERQLGQQLCVRSANHGVTLTDAGQEALVPARALLDAALNLRRAEVRDM